MRERLAEKLNSLNPWVVLVGWVVLNGAVYYAFGRIMAGLPNNQYRWLLFLLTVLWSLTARIGDRRKFEWRTRAYQGPVTLVGPLHPWQTADGSLVLPVVGDDDEHWPLPEFAGVGTTESREV